MSRWCLHLTANDAGEERTAIEALKDRIDVVIRAMAFNTRFIDDYYNVLNSISNQKL
jgi:hypothetical protein